MVRACHTCASVAWGKGRGGHKVNEYKSRKSKDNRYLSYFILIFLVIIAHAKWYTFMILNIKHARVCG